MEKSFNVPLTTTLCIVFVAHLTKANLQLTINNYRRAPLVRSHPSANEMTRPPYSCARCMWNLIPNLSRLSITSVFGTTSCHFIPAICRTQRVWNYCTHFMWRRCEFHATHGDAKSSQITNAADIAGPSTLCKYSYCEHVLAKAGHCFRWTCCPWHRSISSISSRFSSITLSWDFPDSWRQVLTHSRSLLLYKSVYRSQCRNDNTYFCTNFQISTLLKGIYTYMVTTNI